MSCGCDDAAAALPPSGWQLLPEIKWAMTPLETLPPAPAPQPDRAPAAAPESAYPWWLFALLTLVVLHLVGRSE